MQSDRIACWYDSDLDVSKYINCLTNAPKKLPFAKQPFAENYQWIVQNEYSKAVEKMQMFIQLHLDPQYYKWLAKAILYVIENDVDIAVTDQFFIDERGIPKTKEDIRSINSFGLAAVLVGVIHYILLNRGRKNMDGADTLQDWCPQEQYIERTLSEKADICIDREIEVVLIRSQLIVDQNAYEDDITDELKEVSNKNAAHDEKLYEFFKSDVQDALFYILRNDPTVEPINFSLRCDLADISKIWNDEVYRFRDRALRDKIINILALIDQYSYYISDEFMIADDNLKFLHRRNQSIEEANKLSEILQPQLTELREKIVVEFRELYNIN